MSDSAAEAVHSAILGWISTWKTTHKDQPEIAESSNAMAEAFSRHGKLWIGYGEELRRLLHERFDFISKIVDLADEVCIEAKNEQLQHWLRYGRQIRSLYRKNSRDLEQLLMQNSRNWLVDSVLFTSISDAFKFKSIPRSLASIFILCHDWAKSMRLPPCSRFQWDPEKYVFEADWDAIESVLADFESAADGLRNFPALESKEEIDRHRLLMLKEAKDLGEHANAARDGWPVPVHFCIDRISEYCAELRNLSTFDALKTRVDAIDKHVDRLLELTPTHTSLLCDDENDQQFVPGLRSLIEDLPEHIETLSESLEKVALFAAQYPSQINTLGQVKKNFSGQVNAVQTLIGRLNVSASEIKGELQIHLNRIGELLRATASHDELIRNHQEYLEDIEVLKTVSTQIREIYEAVGVESTGKSRRRRDEEIRGETRNLLAEELLSRLFAPEVIQELLLNYEQFIEQRYDPRVQAKIVERLPNLFDYVEEELADYRQRQESGDQTVAELIECLDRISLLHEDWRGRCRVVKLGELGEKYDRQFHTQSKTEYAHDEQQVGTIFAVEQTGYALKVNEETTVIREARVHVYISSDRD